MYYSMGGRHQQAEATPCSNRQEGTEAFMVYALLCSNRGGAPPTIQL